MNNQEISESQNLLQIPFVLWTKSMLLLTIFDYAVKCRVELVFDFSILSDLLTEISIFSKSGEVQNLAVKCIAKLLQRSLTQHRDKNAERICDTLCSDLVSSGKEERQRDIASLALKACVAVIGAQLEFFILCHF